MPTGGNSGGCVIPSSGPWPPCATSGGGNAGTSGNSGTSTGGNSGGCVIPSSGPWPPCASNGGAQASSPESDNPTLGGEFGQLGGPIIFKIAGTGERITENFNLPSCNKAIFYSSSQGRSNVIVDLHQLGSERDWLIVNHIAPDTEQRLQKLSGGTYFLEVRADGGTNWQLKVECAPNASSFSPQANQLNITGSGSLITENFHLNQCTKFVFNWSAWGERGNAIGYLHSVGSTSEHLIMNGIAPEAGERLRSVSGGTYYFEIRAESGTNWRITSTCSD
jgi:hypothetical protein